MKLLNHTAIYFVGILMAVIAIWGIIFYYVMLDEIYDSIDDGLDNQKGLIIQKAAKDSSVLSKSNFDETDYAIREIPPAYAVGYNDMYIDTMMYMQNEQSDEPVRLLKTVFLQNGRYYHLQVATSMVEEDDLLKQLLYSILWLYVGLIGVVILLNNFLLKKIWQPFYNLLKQLKKFRLEKNDSIETVNTRVDEFKLLNETVEGMLKRNVETYNNQKQFIENAAHELQTPLAISINKLEGLADTPNLPEPQVKTLSETLDTLERLTRLNKSLLLLSKIENRQFIEESEVNLGELVKQTVTDFSDQAAYKEVTITVHEPRETVIRMNSDLAIVMITNLVKNAIIHNVKGGTVDITINDLAFSIANTGSAKAHDPEKIFDRFHTGRVSPGTTGLGLAIVKAITTLYRFKIGYRYDGRHTFQIHFQRR